MNCCDQMDLEKAEAALAALCQRATEAGPSVGVAPTDRAKYYREIEDASDIAFDEIQKIYNAATILADGAVFHRQLGGSLTDDERRIIKRGREIAAAALAAKTIILAAAERDAIARLTH